MKAKRHAKILELIGNKHINTQEELQAELGKSGFQVTQEDINICMSVQKGNTELANAINGILDDYTEEDYKNMMNEAIVLQPVTED